jgi:hypothetical protein
LYEHHALPLLLRPFRGLIHPVPVYKTPDLESYVHPSIDTFTESQLVDRTLFALQKIKAFNHHFFNPKE